MQYLPVLLTFHLVFLVYLLVSGTGLRRAAQVWRKAFFEAGALILLGLLAFVAFLMKDADAFPWMMLAASSLMLPFAALRVVPDVVMPRIGLMEVVLTNVAAIALAGLPAPDLYVRQLSRIIGWLMNPFQLLMPMSQAVSIVICLWPSLLAVALAMRGPPGDPRLRLVLVLWTQLIGLIWLTPAAISAVVHFDRSSVTGYGKSVLACVAAVHALLLAINLRRAIAGEKRTRYEGPSDVTLRLSDSLYINRWPWWIFIAGGALGYFGALKLRAVMVDPVLLVSTAYLIAIALGTIALRLGAPADGGVDEPVPDPGRAPARPIVWRSYRSTLIGAIAGILLIVVSRLFDGEIQFVSGDGRQFSRIIAALWFVGALLLLNALLAFAWIVAEGMGREPAKGSRLIFFLVLAGALGGWRSQALPSPHPRGGLESSEIALEDSRAYIWYDEEGIFGGGTGRAVYLENRSTGQRTRARACATYPGAQPVQSIRIVRGLIECRWPDRVALVDDRGESRFTIWGGFDAPRVTSIPAAARRCWLLESPTVAVACAAPVGQHPMTFMNNPGEQGEISWQPGAARYFRLDYQARQPTFCIEVPARATLRDGFSGPVVLVLAYTDTAESAGFPLLRWIVDRDGSCARMASSVDGIHRYQWNHLTAPYFFESHSVPGLLVPVPVSGEEQRPEA